MAAATLWDGLTRREQRLLIKLFGCGTTRNEDPAIVDALRSRGLLDENSELSQAGLFVFTLALREQQARALLRFWVQESQPRAVTSAPDDFLITLCPFLFQAA